MSTLRMRRAVCTPEPVPSATAEADAKRFEATPGVLTVYVVRSAWVDAVRPLTVSVDGDSQLGTLPRSLIRLRPPPGTHQLAFEWNERLRPYHWSDADPAGAKLRARTTRLVADAQWTSSAPR